MVPSRPEEPDNPSGGHTLGIGAAERRGDSHRACQHVLMLARREAAGERRGVIVRSTTAGADVRGTNADEEVRATLRTQARSSLK